MTSYLRQQRYAAFAAGLATATALYLSTKKHYYTIVEVTAEQLPGGVPRIIVEEAVQQREPVLGATARAWAVRKWNEGVDAVFKPLVAELSRRNL